MEKDQRPDHQRAPLAILHFFVKATGSPWRVLSARDRLGSAFSEVPQGLQPGAGKESWQASALMQTNHDDNLPGGVAAKEIGRCSQVGALEGELAGPAVC